MSAPASNPTTDSGRPTTPFSVAGATRMERSVPSRAETPPSEARGTSSSCGVSVTVGPEGLAAACEQGVVAVGPTGAAAAGPSGVAAVSVAGAAATGAAADAVQVAVPRADVVPGSAGGDPPAGPSGPERIVAELVAGELHRLCEVIEQQVVVLMDRASHQE